MDYSKLLDLVNLIMALREAERASTIAPHLLHLLREDAEKALNLMYEDYRNADD